MMDVLAENWIVAAAVLAVVVLGAFIKFWRRKPRTESLDDIYPMF